MAEEKEQQFGLFNLAYKRISEGYARGLTPIILSITLYQELYDLAGKEDPYSEIKKRSTQAALRALPAIEKVINQLKGRERFQASLAASITGNVIDYNTVEHKPDLESLFETFEGILGEKLEPDDSEDLWNSLNERKGKLLFLADNAGEVILDMPLLRVIKEMEWHTTFVVKAKPMINDATIDDVRGTEIESLASIIDSGAWAHGVPMKYVSPEFLRQVNESDLVISKGQANIETFPEIQERTGIETYYITKAKCSHISQAIGAVRGNNVVLRKPSIH